ncbi:DegQ family serine endoprotease [Xanthomonas massiliensis]|jgi:serine protease Do|uniref:DegQ family serine endoprotease n=1 Tax=Xanthomonas massiliensis TaxID=1720302 RepID=UPI0008257C2C|nr:DegQ family serine endoprotease [Xanthomonas massiliensis]
MNHRLRSHVFGVLALTLPLAACAQQAAPPAAAPAPRAAAAPAPQLVTGLPDFTQLVEAVGPAVVSVSADTTPKPVRRGSGPSDQDQVPEFFRRIFGDDFPGFGGQVPNPRGGGGRSLGSGFIISPDGYVLTNHHVIDGADRVRVALADKREFDAKVVGSDTEYDVALLKIEGKDLPVMRIGDSRTVKPGQWAVAIGSPLGLDHSVTAGIISATGRSTGGQDQRYVPFIQTDVAINQGNSGGPLLNTRGEVIGINSQIFSNSGGYMGISFAIPIDLAMNAVEQIKKTGKVTRGQLGVIVGPIDSLKAQGLGLPDSRGALVSDIPAGSAAGKAGIEVGDVIRSVNGTEIDDASQLPPMIGAMAPGAKVRLGLLRDGKPREVTVTLTALKEGAGDEAANDDGDDEAQASPRSGSARLLGLQVADLSAAERSQLGLEAGQGVRVTAVDGVSAQESGLAPGMVIVQVGRTRVGSVAALNQALAPYKKGDVVMLLVRFRGATSFVAVKAGE